MQAEMRSARWSAGASCAPRCARDRMLIGNGNCQRRDGSPVCGWKREMRLALLLAIAASFACVQPALAYMAYVTNERDNTISVVDLDKLETVKTVPVGPWGPLDVVGMPTEPIGGLIFTLETNVLLAPGTA